jgi:hypothetical protein
MSDEFDALLATTELEREKADGIRSLIAASKLAAGYQHRAEVAEAALARVEVLCDNNAGYEQPDFVDAIKVALKPSTPKSWTVPSPATEGKTL